MKTNSYFFTICLLFCSLTNAKDQKSLTSTNRKPSNINKIACIKNVFKLLDQWGPVNEWFEYKLPNNKFIVRGVTQNNKDISLFIYNQTTIAKKISKNSQTTVRFNSNQECKADYKIIKMRSKKNTKHFMDTDLDDVLKVSRENKSSGLIYIWSPHMNLSILGVKEVQKIAKDRGLTLIILLEPRAELDQSIKILKNEGINLTSLRFASSKVLDMLNIHNHYPSLLLFSNGEILDRPRPGYDAPDELNKYLNRVMK